MTRPRVTSTSTEALGASLSDSRYRLGRLEVSSHTHPGRLLGVIVCTSATRPSPPEEGMVIWETDTDTEWAYNGTSWIRISPPPVNTLTAIGAKVYRSSNLAIGNNAFTDITWNAEEYDTSGFFTPSSTNIVVPAGLAGLYNIQAACDWAANGTGIRWLAIVVNGFNLSYLFPMDGNAILSTGMSVSLTQRLNVGDIVTVSAWQNSGANLNLLGVAALSRTWAAVTYLGQ